MTPLRQRMLDALVLHGKAARTQEAYISAVAQAGAVLPVQSGHVERRSRCKRTCCTCCESASCRARPSTRPAARFAFCSARCSVARAARFRSRCRAHRRRCPRSSSREEIARLLACALHLKARTAPELRLCAGPARERAVRAAARAHRHRADRMCVRVVQGKGAKDRYVPLRARPARYCCAPVWRSDASAAAGCSPPPPMRARRSHVEQAQRWYSARPRCRWHHQGRRHPHAASLLRHPPAGSRRRPAQHLRSGSVTAT